MSATDVWALLDLADHARAAINHYDHCTEDIDEREDRR